MTPLARQLALTPAERAIVQRAQPVAPAPSAELRMRRLPLSDAELELIRTHREAQRRAARQPRFIISPA